MVSQPASFQRPLLKQHNTSSRLVFHSGATVSSKPASLQHPTLSPTSSSPASSVKPRPEATDSCRIGNDEHGVQLASVTGLDFVRHQVQEGFPPSCGLSR